MIRPRRSALALAERAFVSSREGWKLFLAGIGATRAAAVPAPPEL